jgi:hypothetical protein
MPLDPLAPLGGRARASGSTLGVHATREKMSEEQELCVFVPFAIRS